MLIHCAGCRIDKPFANLFQQTKSSHKAGEVVKFGPGGVLGWIFLFVYLFISLKLEELSEGSGGWQSEATAAINTRISCHRLTPSDSNAFNGFAQISVHMLGFACWVK